MTTDLLTVGPDERIDLAALVMDQRRIRQLVVLDDAGRLLGILSYRALVRLLAARRSSEIEKGRGVRPYMDCQPLTVGPATDLAAAIRLMLENHLSAVPVVDHDRVVGILSEHDVVQVAEGLLEHRRESPAGS